MVDDEANILDLVATALRYERFDVQTARTGRQGLKAVESFRPHPASEMEGNQWAWSLVGSRQKRSVGGGDGS